ncbi:hypothetical protein [Paenibacillus solani]|nr:hypothetical protein [Paenibacillus solani]
MAHNNVFTLRGLRSLGPGRGTLKEAESAEQPCEPKSDDPFPAVI